MVGVLHYNLLYRREPFSHNKEDLRAVIKSILNLKIEYDTTKDKEQREVYFIRNLLQSIKARDYIADILSHKWLLDFKDKVVKGNLASMNNEILSMSRDSKYIRAKLNEISIITEDEIKIEKMNNENVDHLTNESNIDSISNLMLDISFISSSNYVYQESLQIMKELEANKRNSIKSNFGNFICQQTNMEIGQQSKRSSLNNKPQNSFSKSNHPILDLSKRNLELNCSNKASKNLLSDKTLISRIFENDFDKGVPKFKISDNLLFKKCNTSKNAVILSKSTCPDNNNKDLIDPGERENTHKIKPISFKRKLKKTYKFNDYASQLREVNCEQYEKSKTNLPWNLKHYNLHSESCDNRKSTNFSSDYLHEDIGKSNKLTKNNIHNDNESDAINILDFFLTVFKHCDYQLEARNFRLFSSNY